ncbi:MAG: hypothetical protein JSW60_03960 [Thermoplasmatales archaeon]|nr:MAG: hypothetical protein JSW60_03960 [Thermoplasmatales archaeon]
MDDKQDYTAKLQNLLKKKNTPLVVIKAGSVKRSTKTSNSGNFGGDYYPSSNEE